MWIYRQLINVVLVLCVYKHTRAHGHKLLIPHILSDEWKWFTGGAAESSICHHTQKPRVIIYDWTLLISSFLEHFVCVRVSHTGVLKLFRNGINFNGTHVLRATSWAQQIGVFTYGPCLYSPGDRHWSLSMSRFFVQSSGGPFQIYCVVHRIVWPKYRRHSKWLYPCTIFGDIQLQIRACKIWKLNKRRPTHLLHYVCGDFFETRNEKCRASLIEARTRWNGKLLGKNINWNARKGDQ